MPGSHFSNLPAKQVESLRSTVLDLLANHGVMLDQHPEMFELLSQAGAQVDVESRMVRFPKPVMERLLESAPKAFTLGARNQEKTLRLPRPEGGFYTRTGTGSHGWIDPETGTYRKVTKADLAQWAGLINHLDQIDFLPYLYADDVPVQTADIHGLHTLLVNSDKHIWVQPYSTDSIPYLLQMAETIAGEQAALKSNPVISMIACSLTPRTFKTMDIEVILQAVRASVPIHACSLPGAGGTAPATTAGVMLLTVAEILAMVAMAQAVSPGTPVVACPIIFSTDMQTGRSLQSSVGALKGASGAVQLIKAAFNLPTHNYGSGTDSAHVGRQSQAERSMLTTLMALSGSDILGGAGQLEVATAVSPLQLIIDNEVFAMARQLVAGFAFDADHLALEVIAETDPGQHFLTAEHTLRHCRDGFRPALFSSATHEDWLREGKKGLLDKALEAYQDLIMQENRCRLAEGMKMELDAILTNADSQLAG
ncbi:MAG: trimethylamine methyltransferase family protein [Thermodesulfobacteriota bacterium]